MEIIKGDVFDSFLYPNSMVVHGCNAQGVMGSGVARVVRNNFPAAYYEYVRHYEEHGLKLGEVINVMVLPSRYIANAITQEFYGNDGKRYVSYKGIRETFSKIRTLAQELNIETINYPMIGAGLGGGDWGEISRIIDEQLDGLNHFVWIPE
jgi:O-acetyl-ADP-ribose deacetylase (regulator of RNase III)